jgi:hypothetical protein
MRGIKLGIVGGGPGSFIGFTHRLAAKMDEEFALVGGVFSSDYAKSVKFARSIDLGVKRVYGSVDELIERERALPVDGRMTAVTSRRERKTRSRSRYTGIKWVFDGRRKTRIIYTFYPTINRPRYTVGGNRRTRNSPSKAPGCIGDCRKVSSSPLGTCTREPQRLSGPSGRPAEHSPLSMTACAR